MFFVNPDSRVNRNIPNMALAYASTHYGCRVVDHNTMPDPGNRFLDIDDGDMVISVRSLNYSEAWRIAKAYKEKYPDARIRSLSGFLDIQCCYPFLDFEDKLVYDRHFSDEFPFPDYELFDSFELFRGKWADGKWNFPLMTSLGCPFLCTYCASRNRKYHTRSVDHCIEELKIAKKRWKFSSFEVLDDCFNVKRDRVIEFCDKVEPLKLRWFCTNGLRADLFDEEIARKLKESGCAFVSFGIESLDPETLKLVKKGETVEQIEIAINIAVKYFNQVNGYFIIGLPGSSFEKDLKALEWARKHRVNSHFSFYVPPEKGDRHNDSFLPDDAIFYGEQAKPYSDSYPQEEQMKLYKMTEEMRYHEPGRENILKRGLRKLRDMIRGRRSDCG